MLYCIFTVIVNCCSQAEHQTDVSENLCISLSLVLFPRRRSNSAAMTIKDTHTNQGERLHTVAGCTCDAWNCGPRIEKQFLSDTFVKIIKFIAPDALERLRRGCFWLNKKPLHRNAAVLLFSQTNSIGDTHITGNTALIEAASNS